MFTLAFPGRPDNCLAIFVIGVYNLLAVKTEKREVHSLYSKRGIDRKSTRLNSSHQIIWYAVFCLKKKKPTSPPAGLRFRRRWQEAAALAASERENVQKSMIIVSEKMDSTGVSTERSGLS